MNRYELARKLVLQAGDKALEYYNFSNNPEFEKSGGKSDFYSLADTASEKIITSGIEKFFPKDSILAEESAFKQGSLKRLWIVDPVDGSIPFVNDFPFWGVSLGYAEDGKTKFGLIFLPVENVLLKAHIDLGFHIEGAFPRERPEIPLEKAVIALDYSKQRDTKEVLLTTGRLINHIRYPLTFGSSAYSIAQLLLGHIDGFVHPKPDEFDKAGVDLLVEKWGGTITTFEGTKLKRGEPCSLIATKSKALHEQLLNVLNTPNHY